MKFKVVIQPEKNYGYIGADFVFYCPGCKMHHGVWTTNKNKNDAIWSFNGDLNKPTVSPSLLITLTYGESSKKETCHSFIRDGYIQYLNDCTHALKGQTIELPELPEIE